MGKEGRQHYRTYDGLKSTNNGNSIHSRDPPRIHRSHARCLCFGTHDQTYNHSILKNVLVNVGICTILVAYTLLGSFLFLAIENGTELNQQRIYSTAGGGQGWRKNMTAWLREINHESRARAVESLWQFTLKFNILYQDNWTRLASDEINRFQDHVIKSVLDEVAASHNTGTHTGTSTSFKPVNNNAVTEVKRSREHEWNFARAFLYSLTLLTTIGYGCVVPRSNIGKSVTMAYASIGIPLTLIYLSNIGGLLSRCARGIFTRALCCCLCSNCGYCCYDERRMQEKEKRMRKKRQQEEFAQQQQLQLQEPFYVRANASSYPSSIDVKTTSTQEDISTFSSIDRGSVTIFAPISICLGAMICYIIGGAVALNKLEGWTFIDASYFCFMSLSTIGFGDMIPNPPSKNITIWFCSCYIMSGMALTAMCFHILHEEILHRLNHHIDNESFTKSSLNIEELANDPFVMSS